ncbi:hypothetical protein BCV70DRAFT_148666, partial [Testicularia cyperi]
AGSSQKTVYVGGLPPSIDEAGLLTVFSPFGEIIQVSVPREKDGRNKGFGFLTFSSHDDALDAVDNMHLNALASRTLTVTIARPDKFGSHASSSGPRSRNQAIWHSDEWLRQHAAPATNDSDS